MRVLKAALAMAAFCGGAIAHAVPVQLVSGAADPYDFGYAPAEGNPETSFTANDLTVMSDNNAATSYSFISRQGDYSSVPYSVTGFALRFDFDVSQFESVESLAFSWTGLLDWTGGIGFPNVRIGTSPYAVLESLNFGSSSLPDGLIRTGLATFSATENCFCDITPALSNGIASIWVATDLGFSTEGSTLNNLLLRTFEVSADVTGTLRPGVTPVPEPASVGLIMAGLAAGALVRRRKRAH